MGTTFFIAPALTALAAVGSSGGDFAIPPHHALFTG
jgi:hypothetical protein